MKSIQPFLKRYGEPMGVGEYTRVIDRDTEVKANGDEGAPESGGSPRTVTRPQAVKQAAPVGDEWDENNPAF